MSGKAVKITISKELEDRLKALAERQDKTFDDVLAVAEYADT